MNPLDDLKLIDLAAASAAGNRRDHIGVMEAVKRLQNLIEVIGNNYPEKTDASPPVH